MDWQRRRERRGVFYRFRLALRVAREWSDLVLFFVWVLVTGLISLIPLFAMFYVRDVQQASKLAARWRPWYERDLPGAYLDVEVDNPRVLLWSVSAPDWEKDEPLPLLGERILRCPARREQRTCFVTTERDYLGRADAILFDADNLNYYDYPALRHQGQVWVIGTRGEPPLNPSYGLLSMATMFNWTMSYRSDADITVPYRTWAPPPMGVSYEGLNQITNKKSSIAVWLVSECEADRLAEAAVSRVDKIRNDFEYASFLANVTGAHIINHCGGEACKNRHDCLKRFQNVYFFLLVVESSPCFEHPHQIMFDALQYCLLPIYFGSSSLGSAVPPSSVFDATAVTSVADVMTSLIAIYSSNERYHDYMKWKERYQISVPRNYLCAVCDALYEKRNQTMKDDVVQWWRRGSECKELPTDREYSLFP